MYPRSPVVAHAHRLWILSTVSVLMLQPGPDPQSLASLTTMEPLEQEMQFQLNYWFDRRLFLIDKSRAISVLFPLCGSPL